MKAEISNLGLHRERHFTGVYLQQGRLLVDRDWNELCEILRHLGTAVVSEAIGTGVPRHDGLLSRPAAANPTLILRGEGGRVAATGVIGEALPRHPVAKTSIYQNQFDLPDTVRNLSLPLQPSAPVATKAATIKKPSPAKKSKAVQDISPALEIQQPKPLPNKPQPLQSGSLDKKLLYVDIWDRVVTVFETDPALAGDLIDPALHGADSCFRKQRLVQIKAGSLDDLAKLDDPCLPVFLPERIPPKGNAVFAAGLTQAGEGPDPCDPCAEQVTIERSVTNHLFRLEVHSVEYNAKRQPAKLVLKWSQDNGSRELRPADFATMGDPKKHSYEYFSDATERLLGMRSDDWVAEEFLRGVLDPADSEQASAILPRIREWDGWCRLEGGSGAWTVAGGRDAGGPLGKGASIATGTLQVQVAAGGFAFTLALDGNTFLPGDYWLALVRTRAPETQRVRVISPAPVGIGHHYCILGVATAKEYDVLFEQLSAYDLRRLQHPSLTCLNATDIAFAKPCSTSIYSQPTANQIQNVADALMLLCNVTAEQINFAADCGYLNGAKTDTVKKALEALCIQPANTIPFDPGCDYLKKAKTVDVGAALNALCAQPASAIPFEPICKYLIDQKTVDVGAALNALCAQPASAIPFEANCKYLKDQKTVDVGAALNALCAQPASAIPFEANCKYLNDQQTTDVAAALNALCKQPASAIPFEPVCDYLKKKNVTDVAAALEALCGRDSGQKAQLPVIKAVNWQNDAPMKFSVFMKGLQVTCSADLLSPPPPSSDAFTVTWELPYDLLRRNLDLGDTDDFLTPQIISGDVKTAGSMVTFSPRPRLSDANFLKLKAAVDAKKYDFFPGIRCRVRLLGRAILAKADTPLDGFVPMKGDGNSLALDFKSPGIGQPSDFESWFYVVEG
jgi:hypothetical protein